MAIIYTYPLKATPIMEDSVVITDTEDKNKTKITSLNSLAAIITIPGTGTVKSVTLDFDSTNGTDTGLRLWNSGAATFSDTSQTITNTGSFEVGGALFATHGGTGLVTADYTDGDILYYDSTSTEQLIPLKVGAAIDGDVLTLAGGFPTWAAGGSSWNISGGASTFTVNSGEQVSFVGAGGITTVATESPGSPYTLTVDGSAIPVGVTSVGTVNAMGVSSGFQFITAPALGITATGTVNLGFLGTVGDVLYCDTPSTLARLTPVGASNGDVLTIDTSGGVGAEFPYWAAGGGGGGGNMAFSPVNVAACEHVTPLSQAILYLTIAEHDMTIANCTVWGADPTHGIGNIEVAVYRWGWGTGAIMGQSSITPCGYGPTNLTLSATAPETLSVTAGEWIIVGMVDTSEEPTWFSVSHQGNNNPMFGQVDIVSFPGQLPGTAPSLEEEGWMQTDQRFALTLW